LIIEKNEGVMGSKEEIFSPDDVEEEEEEDATGLAEKQDDAVASTVEVSNLSLHFMCSHSLTWL
jgi:hypothetical protein